MWNYIQHTSLPCPCIMLLLLYCNAARWTWTHPSRVDSRRTPERFCYRLPSSSPVPRPSTCPSRQSGRMTNVRLSHDACLNIPGISRCRMSQIPIADCDCRIRSISVKLCVSQTVMKFLFAEIIMFLLYSQAYVILIPQLYLTQHSSCSWTGHGQLSKNSEMRRSPVSIKASSNFLIRIFNWNWNSICNANGSLNVW